MTASAIAEIALRGGLVPLLAALGTFFLARLVMPEDSARRWAPGASLALGVLVGYLLLPSTETLVPVQFYEWIPYVGVGAAIAAAVMIAEGVWRGERIIVVLFAAMLSAWFIVPTWPDQIPPQHFHVVALGLGIFLLARLIEFLPPRLAGQALPAWLLASAGALSLVMFSELGETFGRLSALPAGALAGTTIAVFALRKQEYDLRSLALPYAVIAGANAFTGYVYPSPPLYLMLLIPFAPLGLWLCAGGPLRRLEGARAIACQALCVFLPAATVVAIVLIRGSGGSSDW